MATQVMEVLVNINGINYSLQLDQTNEAIAFDYQISDVKDISTRQQAKTLALTFPYNSHNSLVFDNILSVNAQSLNFDPNVQTPVVVLVDSIEVFNGYLQVTQGDVNLAKLTKVINCTLISGNMEFWSLVGEGYLTDLDFSEYNHTYGTAAMISSWTASYQNGFFYPLIDYGYGWQDKSNINGVPEAAPNVGYINFNMVFPDQLYPATYVKTIWDRIFLSTSTVSTAPNGFTYSTAPYQYQSNFLNSQKFENLLVPFTRGIFQNKEGLQDFFSAGLSGSVTDAFVFSGSLGEQYFYWGPNGARSFPSPVVSTDNFLIPINNNQPPFGNDPQGYWDDVNFWYNNNSTFDQSIYFEGQITLSILIPSPYNGSVKHPVLSLFRSSDNGATWNPMPTDPITGAPYMNLNGGGGDDHPYFGGSGGFKTAVGNLSEYTNTYQYKTYTLNGTSPPNNNLGWPDRRLLAPNEKVKATLSWLACKNPGFIPSTFTFSIVGLNTGLGQDTTSIAGHLNQNVVLGAEIIYNEILPTNVKKKDFFSWIMKMFNLYIEPSKTLPNTLIIEPRDDYYNAGQILDWSPSGLNKLDTNQDITIDILSNTQDRTTLFTYKEDKDYYNFEYENYWRQIYGQYIYIRENQFSTSQGKIDVGFSPTPIVSINNTDIVIPKFDKITYNNINAQISQTDVNIRIVSRNPNGLIVGPNGTQSVSWAFALASYATQSSVTLDNGQTFLGYWIAGVYHLGNIVISTDGNYYLEIFGVTTFTDLAPQLDPTHWRLFTYALGVIFPTGYPYVGHFDSPYAPTYDINWSTTLGLYYPLSLMVDQTGLGNNLINVYYANQLAQQSAPTSKMITCYLNLNPQDIKDFYFNSKIYLEIDGESHYYYMNAIKGYDPSQRIPTQCELITASDVTVNDINPVEQNFIIHHLSATGTIQTNSGNVSNSSGAVIVGRNNVLSGSNIIQIGDGTGVINSKNVSSIGQGNNLDSMSNFIHAGQQNYFLRSDTGMSIGNGNTMSTATKILQIGSNNFVSPLTSGVSLMGDFNYVGTSSQNIFIKGDYNTVSLTQSLYGVSIFGDNIIATNSTSIYINQSTVFGPSSSNISFPANDSMAYFDTSGLLIGIKQVVLNTPQKNIFIIDQLLTPPFSFSNNIFIGQGFGNLGTLTTANVNTYIGIQNINIALTTGAANTNVGFNAGQALTTGSNNVNYGSSAGLFLTTGNQNTNIGESSNSGVGTIDNTIVGNNTGGGLVNGTNNTMIGALAGAANDVSNSIFVGLSSGSLTSGTENICIGSGGTDAFTFNNCIVIGNGGAQATGNGQLVLGSVGTPLNTTAVAPAAPALWLSIIVNGIAYKMALAI